MRLRIFALCIFGIACTFVYVGAPFVTHAASVTDLQSQIDDRQQKIKDIEAQIAQYEEQLTKIGTDKKTLQNTIAQLDLSRKKLAADISVTQNKIGQANLKINQLSLSISQKEVSIEKSKVAIGQSVRSMDQNEGQSLIETLLSKDGTSAIWQEVDALAKVQDALAQNVQNLSTLKDQLNSAKDETSKQKTSLVSLNQQLGGQKTVLDATRQQQNTVLTQTKNTETEYQKQLAAKVAAKQQFEKELTDFESQLKYNLDPSRIPSPGAGVLAFPIDSTFMTKCASKQNIFKNIYCITQYFGDTAFAKSGAYNGQGHNGVDFGVPTGTRITAALAGTVMATGNTDLVKGCYSYGKWVLVKHANNLATLYGHLSYINVAEGQTVATGDLLGLSGMTGYATGPHLHFTVFAADAVKVLRMSDFKVKTNCGAAYVPVASLNGYLDPMNYF